MNYDKRYIKNKEPSRRNTPLKEKVTKNGWIILTIIGLIVLWLL